MADIETNENQSDVVSVVQTKSPNKIIKTIISLFLAQLISLCGAGVSVGSQILSDHNFRATVSQNVPTYIVLTIVYGSMMLQRTGKSSLWNVFRQRWWKYVILSLIDVEANVILNNAYYYTNLTSIQLLDPCSIPVTMLISYIFLKTRYSWTHFVGSVICIAGMACVIYADSRKEHLDDGDNPILGDALGLTTMVLYAVCNTAQEAMVKEFDRTEYLTFIGFYGLIISGIQIPIIDRSGLSKVTFSWALVYGNAIFTVSLVGFYVLMAIVIAKTSALMLDLTGLTTDFYTFVAGLFLFGISYEYLYVVSFVLIIIGTVVFVVRSTTKANMTETTDNSSNDV